MKQWIQLAVSAALIASALGTGSVAASESEPIPTTITARTWSDYTHVVVLRDGALVASWCCGSMGESVEGTLRASGTGLSGRTLTFSAGDAFICTAVTNNAGVARCDGEPVQQATPAIVLNDGYDVSFAGDEEYLPSRAHSRLHAIYIGP